MAYQHDYTKHVISIGNRLAKRYFGYNYLQLSQGVQNASATMEQSICGGWGINRYIHLHLESEIANIFKTIVKIHY